MSPPPIEPLPVRPFRRGFTDALPICFGYFGVGFAIAAAAVAGGHPVWSPVLQSLTQLSGTSQGAFSHRTIPGPPGGSWELVLLCVGLNLRYVLLGLALALPIALDNTHNMWGANAYSTLAGMIANSWSFALFAPALALAVRDARRERVSGLSAVVFAALALSHFFTSLLAGAAIGLFVLALCAARRWRAARTLALEGLWAGALAAWWLLPLVALNGWSVDFGEQWEIHFWKQLPPMLSPACLGAAAAAAASFLAWRSARAARSAAIFASRRSSTARICTRNTSSTRR